MAAGGGSNYHVYLPKTLKAGRKAPLLFYTNAGGGKQSHIKSLSEYAEIFGWILAVSVESKNGVTTNNKNCKNSLEHILDNLPVDEKRIHYTGNSGGGAQAFFNTEIKKAYGVMPNIGYIPNEGDEKTTVVYGLGGGSITTVILPGTAASSFLRPFWRFRRNFEVLLE